MTASEDRRRPARLAAVAGVTVLLAAGCATSVEGSGRPAPGAAFGAASPSDPAGPSATASSSAGESASASPTATSRADAAESTDDLLALLVPVPSGAREDGSAYGANRTPTLAEFANRVYGSGGATDPTSYLSESGVLLIAHRSWIAADGNAVDVALLLFADDVQPGTWMRSDVAGLVRAGARRVALAGVPAATGYTFTQKSDRGSSVTRFLLTHGKVGVLADYFYDGTFDADQASAWIGAQDALLR